MKKEFTVQEGREIDKLVSFKRNDDAVCDSMLYNVLWEPRESLEGRMEESFCELLT